MHRLFITALACMMITQVFSQRLLIKTNPFTPFMGKYNISNEIGLNHNYSFNLNSSFIYDNDLITWTQNQWGFNENNQWGLTSTIDTLSIREVGFEFIPELRWYPIMEKQGFYCSTMFRYQYVHIKNTDSYQSSTDNAVLTQYKQQKMSAILAAGYQYIGSIVLDFSLGLQYTIKNNDYVIGDIDNEFLPLRLGISIGLPI
ncbi:MAG: hypothetical protein CL847_06895 [Crocinitomicaceae bacterium]|nr:hypothetical protein [Crocinitomicaceae bacterium]|tara:strand:+ start:4227 stop:4829 length:603 start_codon:yes stop_codon:yes gene_type:complete